MYRYSDPNTTAKFREYTLATVYFVCLYLYYTILHTVTECYIGNKFKVVHLFRPFWVDCLQSSVSINIPKFSEDC